jgi:transcriptional accessory protein Tex/SPT6
MVKMSLLRPVLASIELARKASIARRQGLKPAKRPAAKTVAADDMVRSLRAFSEAHAGEVTCELSLAKAGDKIMTNATVSRIAMMQYRTASILIFLDGYLMAI